MTFAYLPCSATTDFPRLPFPASPFVALVIDPNLQSSDCQMALCRVLLKAGCVSLGAWGTESTQWDDAGDWACIVTPDGLPKEPADEMDTWWIDKDPLDAALEFMALQALAYSAPALVLEFGVIFGEARVRTLWDRV